MYKNSAENEHGKPAESGQAFEADRFRRITEFREIPLKDLSIVSQVRDRPNQAHQKLVETISDVGLLHPILVARLSPELMEGYIEVVNRIWEAEHKIEELPALWEGEERFYYLVMAGHSRAKAWCEVFERAERPPEPIEAKVFLDIEHPFQIVEAQLAENTRHPTNPLREAMATVETYRMGQELGLFDSQADFARQKGIDVRIIRQAVKYHALPDWVKEHVNNRALDYLRALDLAEAAGKMFDLAKEEIDNFEHDKTDEEKDTLTKDKLTIKMRELVARIQAPGISARIANEIIQNTLVEWRAFIDGNTPYSLFEDQPEFRPNRQDSDRKRYARAVRGLFAPYVNTALSLHLGYIDNKSVAGPSDLAKIKKLHGLLGGTGLSNEVEHQDSLETTEPS